VANGLLRQRYGCGTRRRADRIGQRFAKLVGVYGHDPVRAVARLVTASSRRFDAGRVLGEWFVNSVGFGFGPAVVQMRNRMVHLRGFLSYLVPIVQDVVFQVRAAGLRRSRSRIPGAGYMMMMRWQRSRQRAAVTASPRMRIRRTAAGRVLDPPRVTAHGFCSRCRGSCGAHT